MRVKDGQKTGCVSRIRGEELLRKRVLASWLWTIFYFCILCSLGLVWSVVLYFPYFSCVPHSLRSRFVGGRRGFGLVEENGFGYHRSCRV